MVRATRYGELRGAVLAQVDQRARAHSKVPTVRELADLYDVSAATMHLWLTRLASEGLIEWTPRQHRSLRLTPAGRDIVHTAF